jgi:hypothetical protein
LCSSYLSTLDVVQRKALSSWTRHWTWYSVKRRRVELDIGRGTAESAVELDSTLNVVQRKALSSWTRHWTWYSGKRCRVGLDIGTGTAENAVEFS